jgi:hypothetical protein
VLKKEVHREVSELVPDSPQEGIIIHQSVAAF